MKKIWLIICSLFLLILSSCSTKNAQRISIELYCSETESYEEQVTIGKKHNFSVPEKFGYSFEGWYDKNNVPYSDNLGHGLSKWEESYPQELYASWKAKKYDIILNANGGSFENYPGNYSAYYDSNISNLEFPIPKLEKKSFIGYFNSLENDAIQLTNDEGSVHTSASILNQQNYCFENNTVVLYAHYDDETTTFIVYGSNLTFKLPTEKAVYNLDYDIKDGYVFEGYYLDDIFSKKIEYPYVVTYSKTAITIYPHYCKATEIGLSYSSISNDKEYEATYEGNETKIYIPDSYYGKKVTRIKKVNAQEAKLIVIPNTANIILPNAFENNGKLEEVLLSTNLKKLEDSLFYNCTNLIKVNIPYSVDRIGDNTFANCTKIESLKLSKNISQIGSQTFHNMTSLKEFNVEADSTIYESIDGVLYRKANLNSLFLISFPIAKEIEEYTLPENVYKIYEYAFYKCRLRKITIENSQLNTIKEFAFSEAKLLMMISISTKSNLDIYENAFKDCGVLTSLILDVPSKVNIDETTFTNTNENLKIFVPSNLIVEYERDYAWKESNIFVLSIGTIFKDWSIEDNAGKTKIISYLGTEKNLTIPNVINGKEVTIIGESAFLSNNVLETIYLPNTLNKIESNAFKDNSNLKYVYISSPSVIQLDGLPFDQNNEIIFYLIDDAKLLFDEYCNSWTEYSNQIQIKN